MKIKTKEANELYQTNLSLLEKVRPSLTDKQIKKFEKAVEYLLRPSNNEEYDSKKLRSKLQKIECFTKKSGTLKMIDDFLDYCETTMKALESHLNKMEEFKRQDLAENNVLQIQKADVCLESSACFVRFISPIRQIACETREAFNEKLIKGVRSCYPKMLRKLAVHLQAEKMGHVVEEIKNQPLKTDLQNFFKGESLKLKAEDELSVDTWIGVLKFILDTTAEEVLIPPQMTSDTLQKISSQCSDFIFDLEQIEIVAKEVHHEHQDEDEKIQIQLRHGRIYIDYFSQLKALADQTNELWSKDTNALNEAYPQMVKKLVYLLKQVKLDKEIESIPDKPIKADLLNASLVVAKEFNVKDWSFILMGFFNRGVHLLLFEGSKKDLSAEKVSDIAMQSLSLDDNNNNRPA